MSDKHELSKKEPDAREIYADIIDLPHWQSPVRPHMSLYDRSAQFAAYKALSGYEDMVNEEARLTEEETELEDYGREKIDHKLNLISGMLSSGIHPRLTFTVFIPDPAKSGGKYEKITARVKRIDPVLRKIFLINEEETGDADQPDPIDFERLAAIDGEPSE